MKQWMMAGRGKWSAAALALAAVCSATPGWAKSISKADNAFDLNAGTSWVGSVAPGADDVATWDAALSLVANRTRSLGADLEWLGVAVIAEPGGNLAINSGNTLTLGAQGFYATANRTFTFNNAILLGTDQTWHMALNTLAAGGGVETAGHTLTLAGNGAKQFKAAITGGGDVIVTAGQLKLTSAGAVATNSQLIATGLGYITFDTANGTTSLPRAKRVILREGRYLQVGGLSSAHSVEKIADNLTTQASTPYVEIRPNASYNSRLEAGSLTRADKGTILLRGTALGVNSIVSSTPNSANLALGTVPALVGAGGAYGTTTNSILPWGCADTTYNANGFSGTGGLATYDSTYGLRRLNYATEFTSTITDGQTQLDNVRIVNTSGTPLTNTINSATTINSLSLDVSTTTGSGIIVDGTGTLTLNSGVIFARGSAPGAPTYTTTADKMIIKNAAIDLNGREGVIMANEDRLTLQRGGGVFEINTVITNDGGNGITITGPGVTKFGGSAANAYTGITTVNAGVLWVGTKSAGINGIPGDVVITGGTVEDSGERIADSATITINDGSFKLQIGNEGNSHSETYSNLVMNGGSYTTGSSGHTGTSTINGTAKLAAGAMTLVQDTKVNVAGLTTLSGTTVVIGRSTSTTLTTFTTYFTMNGGLTISNLTANAYTPMNINNGADTTHSGGKLFLKGDLTFAGNAVNTNTVTIAAPAGGGPLGVMALNGTRTFTIDDGAAETDLALQPVLVNDGAAVGGITKTGAGTLSLMATNTYTGPTTVGAGTLRLDGSLASAVTVEADALLSGTGTLAASGTGLTVEAGGILVPGTTNTIGTLTVSGNVQFDAGSRMRINVNGTNADQLIVAGNVTGGPVAVEVAEVGAVLPRLVMTAAAIGPSFTVDRPDLALKRAAGNTQLWLDYYRKETLILVR